MAMDLGKTLMRFSRGKSKRRMSAYVHTPLTDLGAKIRGEKSEEESGLPLTSIAFPSSASSRHRPSTSISRATSAR